MVPLTDQPRSLLPRPSLPASAAESSPPAMTVLRLWEPRPIPLDIVTKALFADAKLAPGLGNDGDSSTFVRGHRIVLALASPVLGALFEQQQDDAEAVVIVPDVDLQGLKRIMALIYQGEVRVSSAKAADELATVLERLEIRVGRESPSAKQQLSRKWLRPVKEMDFEDDLSKRRAANKSPHKGRKKQHPSQSGDATADAARARALDFLVATTTRYRDPAHTPPPPLHKAKHWAGWDEEPHHHSPRHQAAKPNLRAARQASQSSDEMATDIVRAIVEGVFALPEQPLRKLPSPFVKWVRYNADPEQAEEKNIFDSHCHLDRLLRAKISFAAFKRSNAKEFGSKFEGCVTVICNPDDWHKNGRYHKLLDDEDVFGAYGCHPRFADMYDYVYERMLRECLAHPKAVALGEIGLDSTIHQVPYEMQAKVFERQLRLAVELKKPLCLHIRSAAAKAMDVMKKSELPLDWPIHMHCFSDEWPVCQTWMDAWPNMKFGLAPNHFRMELARNIPLRRILLETDAPYFVPLKVQLQIGRKDERHSHPGLVFHAACQMSKIRNISVVEVLKANRQNVKDVYKI